MSTDKTVERKAETKNSISRLVFVAISILLEIGVFLIIITKLNEYAQWINVCTRIFALILVLVIYGQNKTSAMKMPWIMLIMAFPIMGVALYLLVGLNGSTIKMKRRFEVIENILFPKLQYNDKLISDMKEKDKSAASIATYIRKFSKYPMYQNTDIEYYNDASKGLDAQIEAMKKAEKFIFMEYHSIEDKESWHRIQEVLEDRVKAGVEVRVFYDYIGSVGYINTSFIKKMEAVGIQCRVFNPIAPVLNLFLNNRDHRKITVIDGKVGFTGGYNLANEYFNVTHPYGKWKDTGIRLEGDAVRSLTVTFLEMWNAINPSDKDDTDIDKYLPIYQYTSKENGYIQPYADIPTDDEQVGEDVYISMINKAENYCYIMTPYLIITDEMTHALGLAAKRGVDVRLITPGIPDKKFVYKITRSFYHGLVKNGVKIYEWSPGFCHAKMSVVDDKMAICGTINLDYRSLYHHFENGCFMYNCKAVTDMKVDFDKTFLECRDVTKKYKTGRSATLRLSQLILRLFAQLL